MVDAFSSRIIGMTLKVALSHFLRTPKKLENFIAISFHSLISIFSKEIKRYDSIDARAVRENAAADKAESLAPTRRYLELGV